MTNGGTQDHDVVDESSDSFVASTVASIVTRWSEPVPARELHPLKSSAFHGALFQQLPLALEPLQAAWAAIPRANRQVCLSKAGSQKKWRVEKAQKQSSRRSIPPKNAGQIRIDEYVPYLIAIHMQE